MKLEKAHITQAGQEKNQFKLGEGKELLQAAYDELLDRDFSS